MHGKVKVLLRDLLMEKHLNTVEEQNTAIRVKRGGVELEIMKPKNLDALSYPFSLEMHSSLCIITSIQKSDFRLGLYP